MRCGNVREIFIFMQIAFREGGKAGCTCLRPCKERRTSQKASNLAAKHFHVEDQESEQRWLHRSFHPTLGKHVAEKHPPSSDAWLPSPRGDSTSVNNCNPRATVLGGKGMSALQTGAYGRAPRQLGCSSKPSPVARDPAEVSLP